ncbi:hypothetical protein LG204_00245 [Methylovorus menthalis]|uniref:hypothetical protein n=1 Tax=Methylovorus menthalis TaxID=1002227 RepID=UPI001E46A487|nr:hypothetical protein [Methylovorus menthalis]MCB4809742.1 hypothetical protein [Methylovorus menthalis]
MKTLFKGETVNHYLQKAALAAFILGLTACAGTTPLQRAQLSSLSRTANSTEVDSAIANATPQQQFEFQQENNRYYVRTFNLQTGTRTEMMTLCTPACMVIPMEVPVFAEYAILQELPQKNLLAWGTLEELSKDPDEKISGLMPRLKEQLAAQTKK